LIVLSFKPSILFIKRKSLKYPFQMNGLKVKTFSSKLTIYPYFFAHFLRALDSWFKWES